MIVLTKPILAFFFFFLNRQCIRLWKCHQVMLQSAVRHRLLK